MAKSFDALAKRTMSKAARAKAHRRAKEIMASVVLSELREASGVSQSKLAKTMGIRQPSLSKIEAQTDMRIGTLRRLVEALGGELHVIAEFPRGKVRIDQFRKSA